MHSLRILAALMKENPGSAFLNLLVGTKVCMCAIVVVSGLLQTNLTGESAVLLYRSVNPSALRLAAASNV